jgi:hypothetical protein
MEMQDEDRRIGTHPVDFIKGREPFPRKLHLGKAADDAHPLPPA